MSYLHTKFHDNWISSFRGVAMTRFWDGRTDRQTDGRSDCTPRPAFAFGDAGKIIIGNSLNQYNQYKVFRETEDLNNLNQYNNRKVFRWNGRP